MPSNHQNVCQKPRSPTIKSSGCESSTHNLCHILGFRRRTIRQVFILLCLPATLLATDINQIAVKTTTRGTVPSCASLRRCVSLSCDMSEEAENRQSGSIGRSAVYSPCHTPPSEPKRRLGSPMASPGRAASLRAPASSDQLPLRAGRGCEYTQLQTELYLEIHF
jgi:hypothetical protein